MKAKRKPAEQDQLPPSNGVKVDGIGLTLAGGLLDGVAVKRTAGNG